METSLGWVYIGRSFVADYLEIEKTFATELLFRVDGSQEAVPAFCALKSAAR